MRTIPEPPAGSERPDGASPPSNGAGPVQFIRGAVRNSPWIVIAVTAHVVVLAVLSVIYVSSPRPEPVETPATVKQVARAPEEAEPVKVEAPQIIDPRAVPEAPSAKEAGPVNPDEVVIPDATAGRKGEITASDDPDREPGNEYDDPDAIPDVPSGAPGGTSLGVGVVGHPGTGRPSVTVSRFPGRGGPGGGGMGQGGEGGIGGRPPKPGSTDEAVLAALRWLRNHQSPDGHWDADGFDARCKQNRCDGPGDGTHDVGVTGLSLLAFLGAGHTHQSGACKDTVRRGIRYLRDVQDSEGCVGSRTSPAFLYDHACAALALSEAYGMTNALAYREPAQRSIGFVLKARNPYLAWRYAYPPNGESDTSVTGWMVMALKSAKISGLDVENSAFKDAIAFVERMTEPEFGRTGYMQRGGQPARTEAAGAKFPASKSESLTAVGMTVRIFGGHDVKTDPMLNKGADLLSKCLPRWDVDAGSIDYYYWYYGSLAMFQVGGPRWNRWNEAMKSALLDHQRLEKDRDEFGSWDPMDPWADEGGRVYATALNCLTMEVYYRYPVLGVKTDGK